MKIVRTVTKLRKASGYGFITEVSYIKDEFEQGGTTYCRRAVEIWDDGHITYPLGRGNAYRAFSSREMGNDAYRADIRYGYEFIGRETFEPTEMDMR